MYTQGIEVNGRYIDLIRYKLEDEHKMFFSTLSLPLYAVEEAAFIEHIKNQTFWWEYLVGAFSTWNTRSAPSLQIANAALGIIGELAEYISADPENKEEIISELGDIIYYRTILCYLYGLDLSLRKSDSNSTFDTIALLADVGKKAAFHNKVDNPKTIKRLLDGMMGLDTILTQLLQHNELKLSDVLQYNLDKLSNRHGKNGFNPNYT